MRFDVYTHQQTGAALVPASRTREGGAVGPGGCDIEMSLYNGVKASRRNGVSKIKGLIGSA
jgi:hypothetical protein